MEDAGHSGFTLIELLVTLAIMALMAGLAAPAMARFLDSARLRAAAEAFADELQLARNHALTYRQRIYFSVSVSADQWCFGWSNEPDCNCLAAGSETTACRTGNVEQARIHQRLSVDFPSVQLSGGPSGLRPVQFSPLRGTARAESFTLHNEFDELHVIVSPLGRIRICSKQGRGYSSC